MSFAFECWNRFYISIENFTCLKVNPRFDTSKIRIGLFFFCCYSNYKQVFSWIRTFLLWRILLTDRCHKRHKTAAFNGKMKKLKLKWVGSIAHFGHYHRCLSGLTCVKHLRFDRRWNTRMECVLTFWIFHMIATFINRFEMILWSRLHIIHDESHIAERICCRIEMIST